MSLCRTFLIVSTALALATPAAAQNVGRGSVQPPPSAPPSFQTQQTIPPNNMSSANKALLGAILSNPQNLPKMIGPALQSLKNQARTSPQGTLSFAVLATNFFSAASEALDGRVADPAARSALKLAMAQAIVTEISQLSRDLPPKVMADVLVSVAQTLIADASKSLKAPNPALATLLQQIANTIPAGANPTAVTAIQDMAKAVETGDLDTLKGSGAPKQGSPS